jgi:hypothetical protein
MLNAKWIGRFSTKLILIQSGIVVLIVLAIGILARWKTDTLDWWYYHCLGGIHTGTTADLNRSGDILIQLLVISVRNSS